MNFPLNVSSSKKMVDRTKQRKKSGRPRRELNPRPPADLIMGCSTDFLQSGLVAQSVEHATGNH